MKLGIKDILFRAMIGHKTEPRAADEVAACGIDAMNSGGPRCRDELPAAAQGSCKGVRDRAFPWEPMCMDSLEADTIVRLTYCHVAGGIKCT